MINTIDNHQPFTTIGEDGYLSLMEYILDKGYAVDNDRTGTGTIVSPTPHQLYFPNVGKYFPLFTTKEVSFNMLACEMLWFISGGTNANEIRDIGSDAMCDMWLKWADEHGDLGPVYGGQWRDWDGSTVERIDQLQRAIDTIKNKPASRRIIVSAWNPPRIQDMALPPCHLMYQFTCEPLSLVDRGIDVDSLDKNVSEQEWHRVLDKEGYPKYKLHLHMTQRSCDMFLGVPFNVAEYALLLLMVSQVTNTVPGDFTWTGVNCHIYQNHTEAVQRQLSRRPKSEPIVKLDPDVKDIDIFDIDNIHLSGYDHYPAIKAEVSV